jgi:hypothetical protein
VADDDAPTFAIPTPPERRYQRGGGVSYEGETVFSVRPEMAHGDSVLARHLEAVLDGGPYRYGDWFDLPMPLYLVHDDETGDTFRVAIRDGAVEFHVLPETNPKGLRGLYDRLVAATETSWSVSRRGD